MTAREALLEAFADIQALGALIDGEDTDAAAAQNFIAAHKAAWRRARVAAKAYAGGGKIKEAAPTLEERRARVAEVFAAGMRCALVERDLSLTSDQVNERASAFAAGRVKGPAQP